MRGSTILSKFGLSTDALLGARMSLVSVVIPVFNGERYVADAIRSVLGQSYPKTECVVVDDGSTDRTADVVREFGSQVRYIATENRGVSFARNTGARAASGEFLAFLDADDTWLPHKLETQIAMFRERPELRMVCSSIYMADEQLRVVGQVEVLDGPDFLRDLLLTLRGMHVSMTAVLPASVFHEVGGFYEGLSTSADFDFACRVALSGPVAGISEPLALYRQHHDQMHQDLSAVRRDVTIALERVFASEALSPQLAKLRGRAYSVLYLMLADAYRDQRRRLQALRCLERAIWHEPRSASRFLLHRFGRRLGRLATAGRGGES